MTKLTFTAAFAAVAITLVSTAAPAAPGSSNVSLGGLDLSRPADAAKLKHRIASAMEEVCGSYAGTASAAQSDDNEAVGRCRANARVEADRQLAAIMTQRQVQFAQAK